MSIRTFFRIYSLPFLIILGGLVIYGIAVVVMDKENLIISHSSEYYSQHPNKPLTEDTQVLTNTAANEGIEQLGTDIVTTPTEIEVSTLLETNESQIDSTQIAQKEPTQTQIQSTEIDTTSQEPIQQVAQTQQTYYVVKHLAEKNTANIRKAPSLDAAVIVGATEGEILEVLERGEEWAKVRNRYGIEGYIALRIIDKVESQIQESEVYIVLADNLNVRITPSKNAKVIAHLKYNERVSVLEIQGEWAKIARPRGKYAYISAQFITKASH